MISVSRIGDTFQNGFFEESMHLKFGIVLVGLLIWGAGLSRDLKAQINTISNPLVAGSEYNVFRIPGFSVANDGSLLLFSEGRPSGADPGGAGDIDLVYKRSTDGGATWSNLSVLHQRAGFDYSDPRVVVDRNNGKVHLQYIQWPTNNGQAGVPSGLGENSARVFYQTSVDHGATWSGGANGVSSLNITPDVKDPAWASINTGPGMGIQLKWQDAAPARNGRLLMPAHQRPASYRGVSLYSDDGGDNWTHGSGVTPGFTDESEVIELTNGDLLWDGRQQAGKRFRYISTDGGDTWGQAHRGDIDVTPVDTGMARYSAWREGDDRDRIIYSAPLGSNLGAGNSRDNIGVWTSYDEGKTFINPVLIQSGSAAYSSIDKLADGSIGLVYEVNHNSVRYVNFEINQLEGTNQQRETSHYDGFSNDVIRNRGGIGWSGAWSGQGTFTDSNESQLGGGNNVEFDGFRFTKLDGRLDLAGSDGAVERNLTQSIDLNANSTSYVSLLVSKTLDNSADDGSGEFLDIELLDSQGDSQAAFGVGSNESFFLVGLGDTVTTAADVVGRDKSYFLVAKIVAQDDATGNFDQIFLKVFESGMDAIPDSDLGLNWTLAGTMTENNSALLDSISLEGGNNTYWSLDELRIGTTWASVASNVSSVPEPGSFFVVSALFIGFLARRQRS
ncbi:MAG: hypothetical protein ACI87E_002332 [Mariniblastus sp.]